MRRFTHFIRYLTENPVYNRAESFPFLVHHFKEVGLPFMMSGMPQVEALNLVNKWNQNSGSNIKYWLE